MQVLQTMLSIDQQLHSFILTVRFFDLKNLLLCSLELKNIRSSHPMKNWSGKSRANFTLVPASCCVL